MSLRKLPKVDLEELKKLQRPVTWWVGKPELNDDSYDYNKRLMIMMPIRYMIHDGNTDSGGGNVFRAENADKDGENLPSTSALFYLDNIAPVVKKVLSREMVTDKIIDIGQIRDQRDRVHYDFLRKMSGCLNGIDAKEGRPARYARIESAFLFDFWDEFKELMRYDLILSLVNKQEQFQTEKVREIIKEIMKSKST